MTKLSQLDSTLLIATHTMDHQLRFYCVGIDFQHLSFKIQHLKTVIDCFPKGEEADGPEGTGWYPNARLTHLEYFPQGPESKKGGPSRPFVLGSFTDVSDQPQSNGNYEPFSVVCRWELQSVKTKVHPNYENLSPKRTSASSTKELPVSAVVNPPPRNLAEPCVSPELPSRDCQTPFSPKSLSSSSRCE